MPSDPNSKWRVRIAFLSLFVVFAVGAWFAADLGKLQENISAHESRQAVQDITDIRQIDEVFRKYPSSKFLQVMAMATRGADETAAAAERLLNEVAPPAAAREFNFGAASRTDLEALRRDLKTAQANAAVFMPRYVALLKSERDNVKTSALWNLNGDTAAAMLDNVDKRHAEMTALMSRLLPARADFYRAYDDFVALLVGEFGTYKVVNGQLIFPYQRAVDRYNVVANAMTAAARRVAALEEERKALVKSGQERWVQFVKGA